MRIIVALVLCCLTAKAATHATDGSIAQVRATNALSSVVAGDTITIPTGTFAWTTNLQLTKGVHLQGAGSGRVVGRSRGANTYGTGSKTFTLTTNAYFTNMYVPNGTVVWVWKMPTALYMIGTVTSLSGDQLVVNITNNPASGTYYNWLIATVPQTIVQSDFGTWANGVNALVEITESTSGNVQVSGIRFEGVDDGQYINLSHTSGGNPIKIHDCWFYQTVSGKTAIHNNGVMQGCIYDCSGSYSFDAQSNSQMYQSQPNSRAESWSSVSTMGTNDVGGTNNFYIENCDFHGNRSAGTDFDNNTRIVLRHNIFNHFSLNSHGNDTSPFGVRHVEYGPFNSFEFYNGGDSDGTITIDLAWHILLRGGTGIIVSNFFENITSTAWSDRNEFNFGVWALGRWGVNPPGAYSADDACAEEWPLGRQFGYGWVNGTGTDGQGNTHIEPSGYGSIPVGEPEPLHYWGNSGSTGITISTDGDACVLNQYGHVPDSPGDYIKAGREFTNSVKTGWAAYTYPHPLRATNSPITGESGRTINVSGTARVGQIIIP